MVFGSGIFVKYVKVLEKNDMYTNVHVHVHTGLSLYIHTKYISYKCLSVSVTQLWI